MANKQEATVLKKLFSKEWEETIVKYQKKVQEYKFKQLRISNENKTRHT